MSIAKLQFAVVALCSVASAQSTFHFAEDQAQSNFTWTGTTSVGPIVGNPSNTFQLQGSFDTLLAPGNGQAIENGSFVSGDVAIVPGIHGKIPNPLPFLPPLATVDIVNLHLSPSSPNFAIAQDGSFTATVTMTALSGTMTVVAFGGSPTVTDLTGQVSSPSTGNGVVSIVGFDLHLVSAIDTTFPFSDPTTGISGSVTVVGSLVADWTAPAPVHYCTAKVNSQGCTSAIGSSGQASFTSPAPFTISASQALNQKFGLLFYGSKAAAIPFQGGTLCVQPPVQRTNVQTSGGNPPPSDCSGTFAFDFNAYVQTASDPSLIPGKVVYAQWWSRDPGFAAPNNTGLTDALQFAIAP